MDIEKEIANYRCLQEEAKEECNEYKDGYHQGIIDFLYELTNTTCKPDKNTEYPQSPEANEYRYIDADWLDMIAVGLTQGVKNHPGETWRSIPAHEHAARAMRHLNLYRAGDREDDHLVNASMRIMMAYVVDRDGKNNSNESR